MKLALVLGDQLWLGHPALAAIDRKRDLVLMVEAHEESTHVWSSKPRTAMFLSAMRHFAEELRAEGYRLRYLRLGTHPHRSLAEAWATVAWEIKATELQACEPGDWRIEQALRSTARRLGLPLVLHPDSHFLISRAEFARWAGGAPAFAKRPKKLLMERFYRHMRMKTGVLMTPEGKPLGGRWNYDAENREAFGRSGPGPLSQPPRFAPDAITREVLTEVEQHFPDHPGALADFAWPVTRAQALEALLAFVRDRLPRFGPFQDAMWAGEPFLYHSLLSAALNLHLLDPREVIEAALAAHEAGACDLASAEGFIRQILGWREFMRGVYWLDMPALASANHFGHRLPLPSWYWNGRTEMNCLREVIGQTLRFGYAHHIQRLMVTGNFALVAGIEPAQVAAWYLAVYVDAVEWVEHPNTLGMALYANGGRFTSKPYAASGAYIDRMSNYCRGCRYRPQEKTGPRACPITVFYWDFLARNRAELATNPRAQMVLSNLDRMGAQAVRAIHTQAEALRERLDVL
ncbi:MAG: cryptochrome/photolyase family protein [Casimicrobiaceae bacterium]|nr:cryptochrome/photolyase family protein [Casimicrobiaceae bacterium]